MTTEDSTRPSRHIDAALARIDEALEGAVHDGLDGMRWVPPEQRDDYDSSAVSVDSFWSGDRRYMYVTYGGIVDVPAMREAVQHAFDHERRVQRARALGVEIPEGATDDDIELLIGRALLGPVTACIEGIATAMRVMNDAMRRAGEMTGRLRSLGTKPPRVCRRHGDEMIGGRCRECDRGWR